MKDKEIIGDVKKEKRITIIEGQCGLCKGTIWFFQRKIYREFKGFCHLSCHKNILELKKQGRRILNEK